MSYTLNTSYAIAAMDDAQRYPALQATCYQPSSLKQKIDLCLSAESMAGLAPETIGALQPEMSEAEFGDAVVDVGVLPDDVRWVILSPPKMFCTDKHTKEIFHLERGVNLKEAGRVTLSRLLLAAVANDAVVLDSEGLPQIFTLNLKSSKSALIGSSRDADCGSSRNGGHRTIAALNKALCDHYKAPRTWLTHLVSVQFKAIPEAFKSSVTGESSKGIRFIMEGNSKVLPDAEQKKVFDLVSTAEFKELAADPFGLASRKQEVKTEVSIEYQDDPSKTGVWEEDVIAF